jgi:hypothetical protein
MLKKLAATGIVTVATAGAMMIASPAFADNSGTASTPQNGLLNLSDTDINVIVPVLNNLGIGLGVLGTGTGAGGNTTTPK